MKKNFRIFAVRIICMTLPLFLAACNGGNENAGGKAGDVQQPAMAQKDTKTQLKSILPKKILELDLTDTQRAKCEAAYQEIFTPDIMAQRTDMVKKLKGLKPDSEEYVKFENEIREKFRPYNVQFNKKLRGILTGEQIDKWTGKKGT